MNNLITIENVKGYLDPVTGTAYLNAEDVARGFGFTTVAKSGNAVIRWARVNRETVSITHADGREAVKMNTKWTQKGRLFLYDTLKKEDIVPVIERGA